MTLMREGLLYVSLNCMIVAVGLLVSASITKETDMHWSLWICLAVVMGMAIVVIIWFVRQSRINDTYSEVKGKDITHTHLDHYRAECEEASQRNKLDGYK